MTADLLPPSIWTTGTTEVFKTGTWRAALPRHMHAPSPCQAACPVNGDIAEWIGRIRAHDLRGAWIALTRHNPFPAISGRVCHHPCEAACNRDAYDASLAICRLERYVGDHALAAGWHFDPSERRRAECIAVIGGGPSGLSAAFHLRRRGFAVTLLESSAEVGGLMRYGIPPYRLPRAVLDAEIARITALGVEVRCNSMIASPEQFDALCDKYDAVYLATGARRQKRLPALDYGEPWVLDGAEYLARANAGAPPALGDRVLVIGGGSAAFDAARTARRAGHAVTLLALESSSQLPAQHEEVEEAGEEGVAIITGAMLDSATAGASDVSVNCVRVCFEAGAQRDRFSVERLAGTEFVLHADAIVTSIGQDPDLAAFGSAIAVDGTLVRVDVDQATTRDSVYAGGDLATMGRFVTTAIGAGKRAALAIDTLLQARRGEHVPARASPERDVVRFDELNTFYFPLRTRAEERRVPPGRRLAEACEVQLGLSETQAAAEAERCFSCGTCIECDNCVVYCPDLAVSRGPRGYVVLADYCKGCGLCVKECPTGSMTMIEEAR